MDRSNSISSISSNDSSGSTKPTPSSRPFAYQTRLLERTSSRGGGGSLSRSNSLSGASILTSPTSPTTPSSTRRWTPSHRVGNSLDAVRGKWEERVKAESIIENGSSGSTNDAARTIQRRPTSVYASHFQKPPSPDRYGHAPMSPISPNPETVPIASGKPFSQPPSASTPPSPDMYVKSPPSYAPPISTTVSVASNRPFRSSTLPSSYHSPLSPILPKSGAASVVSSRPFRQPPSSPLPSPDKYSPALISPVSPNSVTVSVASSKSFGRSPPSSPPSSAMSPTQYRSSYMSNKKAATYGDDLVVGRKLGRHLPRIASGDGDDTVETEKIVDEKQSRREKRELRIRDWAQSENPPEKSRRREITSPGVVNMDDVAGVPGRLRLSRDQSPTTASPFPSARLARGLWADTQRQHLQAYEYLCHVGEAQEWVELCLNQELGFGVVEMEESLRNGVVLAKLAQVFQGDGVVRKIYEVCIVGFSLDQNTIILHQSPKLDFRHSDNINYFFNFVRAVGLPEVSFFPL